LIEPTEKGRLAGECRKAVQGVKEVVRHQRQVIGAQVRELNAHRTDEAAASPGTDDPHDAPKTSDNMQKTTRELRPRRVHIYKK